MKRVLTILLCCLMAFGLSGCGKSKVEDAKKNLQESYEKYTGDQATDIVDYMLIFVNKTSKYNDEALTYTKKLIKANYNKATDTEIDTLLKEAKDKSSSGKTAYNGKGISVGYLDKDDYYQYQVLRFYK